MTEKSYKFFRIFFSRSLLFLLHFFASKNVVSRMLDYDWTKNRDVFIVHKMNRH